MSIARYPDGMPLPLADDFSIKRLETRFKSETSAGKRVTSQYLSREFEVSCTLLMTDTEAGWFESFVQHTLACGTLPFEFPVWHAGRVEWRKALLVNLPEASGLEAGHVEYSLKLKVW